MHVGFQCPVTRLLLVAIYVGFLRCVNRLGISYPELTEMQVRAIFEAAVSTSNKGVTVLPEIMVPLVGTPQARFLIFLDLSHQGFDYM